MSAHEEKLWSPEDHVGYYAQVWAGDNFQHYAIFPLDDGLETVDQVRAEIPQARAVVVYKRGAMGVSTLVGRWREWNRVEESE
jgi:hypothetical protein